MKASLTVARVAGIDVKVHVTFLGLVALSTYQWSDRGTPGLVFGSVWNLALFSCIALHELGHSLVAQAYGIRVREILLFPLGGVAKLEGTPRTPLQEVLIAFAGPLVNVVIALALALALWLEVPHDALSVALTSVMRSPAPEPLTFVVMLTLSNVFLAVFNLLPAFPMDGGRVFRAALTWPLGAERATQVAVTAGRVLAAMLAAAGVVTGNPMLVVIAAFVVFTGSAELQEQRFVSVLSQIQVKDALNPYTPRFSPSTTLGEAVQALVASSISAYAVEHFGKLAGVVTREAIVKEARVRGADGYVAGIMERDVATVSPDDVLDTARELMMRRGVPYVAVSREGLFLGLITDVELARQEEVAKLLRSKRAGRPAPSAASRRER